MSAPEQSRLRVLLADEDEQRLARMAEVADELGHEVAARETDVTVVAEVAERERPDVALVSLHHDMQHALDLIAEIADTGVCPVIALVDADDDSFIAEAARRGIFAYIGESVPERVRGALTVALSRFRDYRDLEAAFARRAVIERAKGIVMERHGVDERAAFDLLRRQARASGARLVDVAAAVVQSRPLLPPRS